MEGNVKELAMRMECVRRLCAMQIDPDVTERFKQQDFFYDFDHLLCSVGREGLLFPLDNHQKAKAKEINEKYGVMPYFVIRTFTTIGTMDSYLYVSEDDEEWGDQYHDIIEGYPIAYVDNLQDPDCSEFGGIQIKRIFNGCIVRIG